MSGDRPAAAPELYCPACERSFASADGRCPDDGTALVSLGPTEDRLLGLQIDGRFTIKQRLGAGGMGIVYRGLQHSIGREVAIKIVNPALVSQPQVVKRFLREAKLASRLAHPNAVAVLDFGQTRDGLFYLVMELLQGPPLSDVLARDGAFDLRRLRRIGGQLCEALAGAHRLDVIHRDLKPSNVILLEGDHVKVLDFGLAKSLSASSGSTGVTESGALLGTPAYMSPEAALGEEVDARADLYSLGVVLYELAAGRLPFAEQSLHDLLMRHAAEPPVPAPRLPGPPRLAEVVDRLLARYPADRYQTAGEAGSALAAALDEALRGDAPASPATPAPRAPSHPIAFERTLPGLAPSAAVRADGGDAHLRTVDSVSRRRDGRPGRWIAAAVGVLIVAAVAVAAVIAWPTSRSAPPTAPAAVPAPPPAAPVADPVPAALATPAAAPTAAPAARVVDAAPPAAAEERTRRRRPRSPAADAAGPRPGGDKEPF